MLLGHKLGNRGDVVRFQAGAHFLSFLAEVLQTSSETPRHLFSTYRGYSIWEKAAGA